MFKLRFMLLFSVFVIMTHSHSESRNIKIIAESGIDTTELKNLVNSLTKDCETDRDKMIALWSFITGCPFYHWCEARDGREADSEFGVVHDPIKAFNVYGTIICYQVADILANMAMEAGIPARTRGFPMKHKVMEAWYDNAWHLFDATYDCQAYYVKPDGKSIACLHEIIQNPHWYIMDQPNPSDPFFAFDHFGGIFWPWESKEWVLKNWFEAFTTDELIYYHPIDSQGHTIDFSLRRGEKVIRYWDNEGKWYCTSALYRRWNRDKTQRWVSLGPHDPRNPKNTYANGILIYKPDWESSEINFLDGLYHGENYRLVQGKIYPGKPGISHVCFHIRSPYLLVGHPNRLDVDGDSEGGALFSADFYRKSEKEKARIFVSTDNGVSWINIWDDNLLGNHSADLDFTLYVEGRYEYLIKVELETKNVENICFGNLELKNSLFYSPLLLPGLNSSTNRFTVELSEPSERLCIDPDFTSFEAVKSRCYSIDNLEYNPRFTNRLTPPEGQHGSIVYEIDPPGKGTIQRLSITGSFSHEPGSGGNDAFSIYYAVEKPETWQLLWKTDAEELDNGWQHLGGVKEKYGEHWRYDKTVEAYPAEHCEKCYVKFELNRTKRASLNGLKIYAHYEPEQNVPVPEPENIVITHNWTANDSLFTHQEILQSAQHTYAIQTQGQPVKNKSIIFEVKNIVR
ncbi:MAG: hypothetical protein JXB48_17590 [Candidatus Latescibacteria bacterium]|nr:hypothetical protein [Candidatus Latescibacterota bacterium]